MFNQARNRGCFICGQTDHQASECTGKAKTKVGDHDEKAVYVPKPYIFLHINILREYLEAELKDSSGGGGGGAYHGWDFERAIDDWVFLCFFIGNDFLPHLPSLEIREGAIDRLVGIYHKLRRNSTLLPGKYLTDSGDIDLAAVQVL